MKPITRTEYEKRIIEECKGWFKDHKATVLKNAPHTIAINWKNPGTSIFMCRYILHGPWFCAMGDIGECIHQWSEKVTPRFVANCNLDYYMGKCQASDDFKSRNSSWSCEVAAHALAFINSGLEDSYGPESRSIKSKVQELIEGGDLSHEALEAAAHEIYNDTGDSEAASSFSEAGQVYSHQAIGRWVGFKMAVDQLGL